jgi:hypothetical protein
MYVINFLKKKEFESSFGWVCWKWSCIC